MTKQELDNDIMDAKLLIKKVPGNDEFHMEVIAEGTVGALACIIGKALTDIANTSREAAWTTVTICRAIVDQYEEQMKEEAYEA